MNTNERTIMDHCKEKYVPLKPLFDLMSKNTVYERTKILLDKGYLVKKNKLYKTTKLGLYELGQEEMINEWNEMEKIIPHLKYTPTEFHRAMAELVIAAIVSRRDGIMMDHHPTFIFFGDTMKWKTWLVKFICTAFGFDIVKTILYMPSESGRSIFTRKNKKGEVEFKSGILKQSLVCFDEYHEASPDIKKLCKIYLQGDKKVSSESEVLTIEPVPIFTLNPKEADTLEKKIGFNKPHIRRSIIGDFNKCTISQSIVITGNETLKKVKTLGTIELPKHRNDCTSYNKSVYALIKKCTIKDMIKNIDIDMIIMLCSGMTGFLPEKKAVAYTLRNYFTVIETLGWTKPNWRESLDDFVNALMTDSDYLNKPLVIEESHVQKHESGEKTTHNNDCEYDWTNKKAKVIHIMDDNNISDDKLIEIIHSYLEFERLGFGIEEATTISKGLGKCSLGELAEMISDYRSLNKVIKPLMKKRDKLNQEVKSLDDKRSEINSAINKAGSSPERVGELLRVETILEKQGIKLSRLEEFIQTILEMNELGFDLETARYLANELGKKGNLNLKENINNIVRNIGYVGDLLQAIEEKERYMKDLEKEKKKINNQIDDLKSEVSILTKKGSVLEGEVTKRKKEKSELNHTIEDIKDSIDYQWMEFDSIGGVNRDYKKVHEMIKNIEKTIEKHEERLAQVTNEYDVLRYEIEQVNGWRRFIFSADFKEFYFPWSDLERMLEIREGKRTDLGAWKENTNEKVRKGLIDAFCEQVKDDIIPKWKHESDINKQKRKIEEIENNLEKSRKIIHEKDIHLNDLNKKYKDLQNENKELKDLTKELKDLKEQQKKMIENLKSENKEFKDLTKELKDLKEQQIKSINELKSENEEYKDSTEQQFKSIENLQNENKEYKGLHEKSIKVIKRLKRENEEYKDLHNKNIRVIKELKIKNKELEFSYI